MLNLLIAKYKAHDENTKTLINSRLKFLVVW